MFLKSFNEKENIFWTKHVKNKMRYYCLSENMILKILRKPERMEEGIAPQTIAQMQVKGTKKHPAEIWIMYQMKPKIKSQKLSYLKQNKTYNSKKITIISAWRYPGRTPKNQKPIIPEDVLEELVFLQKNENEK